MSKLCSISAATWSYGLPSSRPDSLPFLVLPLFPIRRAPPEAACFAAVGTSRRSLTLFLASSLGLLLSPAAAAAAAVEGREEGGLEAYTDGDVGFTLLRPLSWPKVDKAGATALFVSEKNKNNSIGVVVNPVRLSSLKDFGTPEFVAEKLINAERRKVDLLFFLYISAYSCSEADGSRQESTKEAQMVAVAERAGAGGSPVYEFEYTVDSTRGGLKRVFSAVLVEAGKLYILNITASDKPETPLGFEERTMLESVLHSFNVLG